MLETKLVKVAGAVAALGAAVLLYRVVNRVFVWIFADFVSGVGAWFFTAAAAILLVIVAHQLWPRWRLVLGSALLLSSAWAVFQLVPDIHRAASALGDYDERFVFVSTNAAWCTAIVLTVIGLVTLSYETLAAAIQRFSRKQDGLPVAGAPAKPDWK